MLMLLIMLLIPQNPIGWHCSKMFWVFTFQLIPMTFQWSFQWFKTLGLFFFFFWILIQTKKPLIIHSDQSDSLKSIYILYILFTLCIYIFFSFYFWILFLLHLFQFSFSNGSASNTAYFISVLFQWLKIILVNTACKTLLL